ncbi:MAG: hypothetical protein NT018_09055 [Armatimonadetes bacterium]|nr:hypothetical protein [Armatimonadota bacterium]
MKILRFAAVIVILLAATVQVSAYNISEDWRWKVSSFGKAAKRGDPIKVSWQILPDTLKNREYTSNNINAFLESKFKEKFVDMCRFMFGRISAVSGLDCVELVTPKNAKQKADIRIIGRDLNGMNACSDMPQKGGTLIQMSTVIGAKWDHGGWINVTMHEMAHSVGLAHDRIFESPSSKDPQLNASIVALCNGGGPQFDDIYALQRLYGDKYERNGGNDTLKTATDLGNITSASKSLGSDIADSLLVKPNTSDFIGIDGANDVDFFKFHLSSKSIVSLSVTPKGPSYEFILEGEKDRIKFDAIKQSDLFFEIYDSLGTRLFHVNRQGMGKAETLSIDLAAGDYFVKVAGSKDNNQMYRLDVSAMMIP